ncbi:MAG: DUF378 domain-containing protein [Candidatus Kerfeldbacteria bacterium]
MNAIDWLAMILVVIGGLNWGLVIFKFDLVAAVFGLEFGEVSLGSQIVYGLVALSALYMLLKVFMKSGGEKPVQPTQPTV